MKETNNTQPEDILITINISKHDKQVLEERLKLLNNFRRRTSEELNQARCKAYKYLIP